MTTLTPDQQREVNVWAAGECGLTITLTQDIGIFVGGNIFDIFDIHEGARERELCCEKFKIKEYDVQAIINCIVSIWETRNE